MTTLSESVRVRLEPELREQLEEQASKETRPVGNLVRRYVREGLERDRAKRGESRRV